MFKNGEEEEEKEEVAEEESGDEYLGDSNGEEEVDDEKTKGASKRKRGDRTSRSSTSSSKDHDFYLKLVFTKPHLYRADDSALRPRPSILPYPLSLDEYAAIDTNSPRHNRPMVDEDDQPIFGPSTALEYYNAAGAMAAFPEGIYVDNNDVTNVRVANTLRKILTDTAWERGRWEPFKEADISEFLWAARYYNDPNTTKRDAVECCRAFLRNAPNFFDGCSKKNSDPLTTGTGSGWYGPVAKFIASCGDYATGYGDGKHIICTIAVTTYHFVHNITFW